LLVFVRKALVTIASGLLVATGLVSGCTSPAPLTDAGQILDETIKAFDATKSVHFELTAVGTFAVQFGEPDATPTPSPTPTPTPTPVPTPTPIPTITPTPSPENVSLEGAHAEGDIDMEHSAAHITGTLPTVPDLAGEVIVYAGYAYVRAPGEAKFTAMGDTELTVNPGDPTGPPISWVRTILEIAADDSLNPVLLGDSEEADGTAYHIQVQATPAVVKTAFMLIGDGVGNARLDIWIHHGDFHLLRMELHMNDSAAGPGAARLVLSRYDSIDPIKAPDASQFEIPGLNDA
jgi:hypothetical protein